LRRHVARSPALPARRRLTAGLRAGAISPAAPWIASGAEVAENPYYLPEGVSDDSSLLLRSLSQRLAAQRLQQRPAEALARSEAAYRALAESIPAIVYRSFADELSGNSYVSPQIEALLGFTAEQWVHEHGLWVRQLHPDDRERVVAANRRMQHGEVDHFAEGYRYLARDGHVVWFHDQATLARDDQGRPLFSQGVMLDISDRKRAEEALRRSEEGFRSFIEQSSEGIAVLDTEGCITEWNRRMEVITGLRRAEVLSLPLPELLGGLLPDRDRAAESTRRMGDAIKRAIDSGATPGLERTFEVQLRRADGETRALRLATFPISTPAGLRLGAICQDTTEERRAEEERRRLEQSIQQVRKLESLATLAGGVAHDFNNLLTSILGDADLALRDLPPGSSAHETISEVVHAAKRASGLAAKMLAYSGHGHLAVRRLQLSSLVGEMQTLLKAALGGGIGLRLELAPLLPPVLADPSEMHQVLLSLVSNASEAIGEHGGLITVRTSGRSCDRVLLRSAVVDDGLPEGEYVASEVEDSGSGMDAETLGRIFEPFFSTRFPGRGLGLAAVLGIVRGHRGAVLVHSEPGQGSLFTVLLPAASEGARSQEIGVRSHTGGSLLAPGRAAPLLAPDSSKGGTIVGQDGRAEAPAQGWQQATHRERARRLPGQARAFAGRGRGARRVEPAGGRRSVVRHLDGGAPGAAGGRQPVGASGGPALGDLPQAGVEGADRPQPDIIGAYTRTQGLPVVFNIAVDEVWSALRLKPA